jgi:TetR/AcrR family fatty acid metabolism transcriptional regulator
MPLIVDKQKKRRTIIEAAIAVFSRTGYQRAKIKDIADEAGVGKGTVYEYFRSKQELFLQMGECLFERHMEDQRRKLELVFSPEEQLRALIVSTLEQTARWAGFLYLIIDIWSEMDQRGEQDRFGLLKVGMLERAVDIIAEYVRECQARGVFTGFDVHLAAHIIMAALDGLVIQLIIKQDAFDVNVMAEKLTDVLLRGMSTTGTNRENDFSSNT